jgi:cell division septal protein FtsQ
MRKYRQPFRVKRKKSFLKNTFFWKVFAISFFVLAVLFYLFFFLFQAKEILVEGQKTIEKERIENLVREKIENKVLFFRTKSLFLIKKDIIEKEIKQNFPKVKKVQISFRLPDKIRVLIFEREPLAIFCKEECYFIDDEGILFEKENNKSQNLLRIYTQDEKIDAQALLKILDFQKKIENEFSIKIENAKLLSQEEVIFTTSENWQIIFNPKGDLNWQLVKLRLLLEREIPAEKRKNLDYVELRFDNLAPFKYKTKE